MSFSHLYYTSARTGVYKGLGFQIYNVTKEINEIEKEDIIKFGGYKAPEQLSSQIDEQSIETLYPKSFSYYALKSGRYALTSSRYIGKDYSNRNGNYFSDTVVFDLSKLKGKAIEYFESADFKQCLTEQEEKNEQPPGFLKPANSLQLGTTVTYKKVQEFIQLPGNAEILKKMLESVIRFSRTNKQIVILDRPLHIAYWIAAVQYCFPDRLAATISFTTYTDEPLNFPAIICGVYDGEMPPSSWAYNFEVFNIKYQSFPHNEISSIVENIVNLFVKSKAELDNFITFVDFVAGTKIDNTLEGVMPLYELMHHSIDSLSEDELRKALAIYLNNEDTQTLQIITSNLALNWLNTDNLLMAKIPCELVQPLVNKFFAIAKTTLNEEVKRLAYVFFLIGWVELLKNDKQNQSLFENRAFFKQVYETNVSNKQFHKMAIEEKRLSELYNILVAEPREELWNAILMATFAHLEAAGANIEDEEIKTHLVLIIGLGIKNRFNMDEVYEFLLQNGIYFYHTIRLNMDAYANDAEKLGYLLETMIAFVEKCPALNRSVIDLIHGKPAAQEHLLVKYQEQLATSQQPFTTVQKVLPLSQKYVGITPEQEEQIMATAADRLLASPTIDLKELQLLWENRSWVELLPPNTNFDLIEKGLQQVHLATSIKMHESLLNKWYDFGKEFAQELPVVKLLLLFAQAEKQRRLNELDMRNIQLAAKELSKEQMIIVFENRLEFLLKRIELEQMSTKIFFAMTMQLFKTQILNVLKKTTLEDNSVQLVANYYEYLIEHYMPLDDQDRQLFNETKGLKKNLKETYKENGKLSVYETIEQQVKGMNGSFFDKIFTKNPFKKNLKGDK